MQVIIALVLMGIMFFGAVLSAAFVAVWCEHSCSKVAGFIRSLV